jgi:adenosylmethionine-8-amino-7-oxononanoate aminotransferase
MRAAFVDRGVWVRPFGRVIYLMPALNVAAAELATLIAAVVAVARRC